jgi:hypothetical protein
MTERELEKFYGHVEEDEHGCHVWQGCIKDGGYGYVRQNNCTRLVHRAAYEHYKGEIPIGMVVRHKCDNRACANPDHLILGTQAQNMRDMVDRGRHFSQTSPEKVVRGSRNGQAKLTEDQVREIRAREAKGVSAVSVAALYNVAAETIRSIWKREAWQHI